MWNVDVSFLHMCMRKWEAKASLMGSDLEALGCCPRNLIYTPLLSKLSVKKHVSNFF